MARAPKSPIDDVAKFLFKKGIKLTKKEILDMKRYARGSGRSAYLDRKPNITKPKTAAQKRVQSRLQMIEDRRQDKAARMYGDNNGPHDYFFGKYGDVVGKDKKMFNKAFSAEERIGAENARKVQKSLSKKAPAKKAPVKKAPAKKAPAKKVVKKK